MSTSTRRILAGVAVLILLIVLVVTMIPLFLNTDSFRTRVEATLTRSLGRQVTIAKLSLSLWTGSLVATDATIADDPSFSTGAFLQAKEIKIKVDVLPFLLSRSVQVRGFVLDSPQLQLLRMTDGRWNYASLGHGTSPAGSAGGQKSGGTMSLEADRIQIENATILLGTVPATPGHVYRQVNLDVKDFSLTKPFTFEASAQLPAGGTLKASGKAGALDAKDAAATPFSVHVDGTHVDPLAAGLVTPADGVTGSIDGVLLDAAWDGQQLHVAKLSVQAPKLTLVKTRKPAAPPATGAGKSPLESLIVDDAELHNGTFTVTNAGQAAPPAVYQKVEAKLTKLTPTTASPFTASAVLPGGGSVSANGSAGPYNSKEASATPLNAQVTAKHIDLATSGLAAPDAGIAGMADVQAQIQSNGQQLHATGTANVAGIRLARNGQPSAKPLQVQFAVAQDEHAKSGTVQNATISVGGAVVNISGTYQENGPTTGLNLKSEAKAVSIDALEAFLPALGVRLPQGSRLQGGTLTTSLAITGTSGEPVISGPVQLANTQLAGFNLGAKLQDLSRFTGGRIGSATGSGTNVRSLSMVIREAGGAVQTDKIALSIAGVGTATGAGSVSQAGALNYTMLLKLTELAGGGTAAPATGGSAGGVAGGLAGLLGGGGSGLGSLGSITGVLLKNGIPVVIGGTTSNPTFAPDLRGALTGAGHAAGAAGAKAPADPVKNVLGGIFGKSH